MVRLNQSYVAIVGKPVAFRLPRDIIIHSVIQIPPFISLEIDQKGRLFNLYPHAKGRGKLLLDTSRGRVSLPLAVFNEREVFLITALSSNYHKGWDPSLQNRLAHRQCCGDDKSGNAFIHVINMENILHGLQLPVTWFIDPRTAEEQIDFFRDGSSLYGDEIALMPPSFSHFNPLNYNLYKTRDQTRRFIGEHIAQLENLFDRRVSTLAVDQFLGSVGTNFTKAAVDLDIRALWGMGFDHYTCDTSMYHKGCPWNPYRPDWHNFRIPGASPLPVWLFQWTFRDLVNTVHTPGGASGAVMFSTDVDDILAAGIARHQPDYYHRIAGELLKNKSYNEFLVLTIHQEDHDSWNEKGCEYYHRFFEDLVESGGYTPATMGEVAAWLDLKYPLPAQPSQCLRLEDPLTCKDQVEFIHPDVKKPPDWPSAGDLYPTHVFFYNDKSQIVWEQHSHAPLRYINYQKRYSVREEEVYPEEELPSLKVKRLDYRDHSIRYHIHSDADYELYPLALWTHLPPPEASTPIPGGFVIFLNLSKGENRGILSFRQKI